MDRPLPLRLHEDADRPLKRAALECIGRVADCRFQFAKPREGSAEFLGRLIPRRNLRASSGSALAAKSRPRGSYVSRTDIPPSTINGLPVMKVDRSERRKGTACAISFALAIVRSRRNTPLRHGAPRPRGSPPPLRLDHLCPASESACKWVMNFIVELQSPTDAATGQAWCDGRHAEAHLPSVGGPRLKRKRISVLRYPSHLRKWRI